MQIRGGAALSDANKELTEVVAAVKATGQDGYVNLKIVVKADKTDETVVRFKPHVDFKKPRKGYAEGIFYVNDKTGEVTREDPRQIELQLERDAERAERDRLATEQGLTRIGRGA
jgi:hypothetical protein